MRGLLILAGGLSSRFGEDKAFAKLQGKTFLKTILDRTLPLADEAVLVVRHGADLRKYQNAIPQVRIVADCTESQGPLVGIATGLYALRSEYVAVLSCDTPTVNPLIVATLYERAFGFNAAIPQWPDGEIEPLQAVYEREPSLAAAKEALAHGELANRAMIRRLKKVNYVSVDDLVAIDTQCISLRNVNTKKDLEELEKLLK